MPKNQETLADQPKISYWKDAFSQMKSTRILAITALFIALKVAASTFFIVLPGPTETRVYFSFLVTALGSFICGPVVGFWAGFISDTVAYLIFPTGAYFFGYTLTAMVGGFLFGVFLYRRRISVLRLFLAKFAVNVVCNIMLNGLWSSILSGGFWPQLMLLRTPKNLVLLPLETLLLYLVFRGMLPTLQKRKLCTVVSDKVKLF